ncbi:MAG: hypothetical protein EA369_00110 [Bradymonadales bacterium]|nr:MAG: hypothetical protein EA369_00110 [Bradymonadales bacterium]
MLFPQIEDLRVAAHGAFVDTRPGISTVDEHTRFWSTQGFFEGVRDEDHFLPLEGLRVLRERRERRSRGRYNSHYEFLFGERLEGLHDLDISKHPHLRDPFEGVNPFNDSATTAIHPPSQDPYATLGIDSNATNDEIKGAYRRLARRFHPDISQELNAEDKFKEAQAAYEYLKSVRGIE